MALFGSKKKKEETAPKAAVSNAISMGRDLSHVLTHARITEKASMHQADSVYTFDIAKNATKRDIMQAVRSLYKVTPRMVRVVTIPAKTVRSRKTGQMGRTGGGKKAYVYLKKGDTITLS